MCEAVLQSEEEAEGTMQLGRTVLNELNHHPKEMSEMRLCVWGNRGWAGDGKGNQS